MQFLLQNLNAKRTIYHEKPDPQSSATLTDHRVTRMHGMLDLHKGTVRHFELQPIFTYTPSYQKRSIQYLVPGPALVSLMVQIISDIFSKDISKICIEEYSKKMKVLASPRSNDKVDIQTNLVRIFKLK